MESGWSPTKRQLLKKRRNYKMLNTKIRRQLEMLGKVRLRQFLGRALRLG